jgi:hypothetical protein
MTDLEELRALLGKWGVPCQVRTEGEYLYLTFGREHNGPEHPKVNGYRGFYSQFVFSLEGEFDSAGAWE